MKNIIENFKRIKSQLFNGFIYLGIKVIAILGGYIIGKYDKNLSIFYFILDFIFMCLYFDRFMKFDN